MSKKLFVLVPIIIIAVVLISLFIPRDTQPASDTRVILEHTHKTYIAPMCFEGSNATNFIAESTLEEAHSLSYNPHNSCTEDALTAETDSLLVSLLKEMGILDTKWDNW